MKKVFYLLVIILISAFQVKAQQFPGGQYGGSMPMDGKISGSIVDGNDQTKIEYASVGLYKMRDSSLVTGVVSDTAGRFVLSGLPYGRFYVEIKVLGYKKTRVNGILVTPNQKAVDMGNVKLQTSSQVLQEVQVTGTKPPIEYKLDKKVVNVSQQITANGGTAVDVLENVPSVQTDVEGNVTVRGSSSFTVLIDGKPSVLKGSDALQQLPASIIDQIEIITNPSAKYDPDGSAGIINVILKKQKISGITGVANVSVGTGNKYNGDVLLNIRNSKFNYFIGANYIDMNFHMKGVNDIQRTKDDSIGYRDANVIGKMDRTGKGVKAGFDYSITDRKTLSFSVNYAENGFHRNIDSKNHEYTTPASSDVYYLYNNNGYSPHKHYNTSLDYLWKLDDKGHQLSATVYYSHGPSDNNSTQAKFFTDNNWNVSSDPINQLTTSNAMENEFRGKIDYSKPLGTKGKLEAGYQGRYEATNSEYHLYNVLSNTEVENMNGYNKVNYADHIEAVYATVSNKTKLFEYQLGLRGEYTGRDMKNFVDSNEFKLSRFDYFPSIHLSKELPWDLQVMASYSRRINRPNDRQLDPYKNQIDDKTYQQGNTELKPEYTGSYELSLQKRMGAGFFSLEGFYRQTTDMISQKNDTVGKTTIQTFSNFGASYTAGSEAMLNMPLNKWWTVNASGSMYQYHIDASSENRTSAQNSTNWNARINSTFRMNWGMQLQLNYFYNGPSATPQGHREAFSFTSIGLKQEMLKKKASLTLQVRDIFGTGKFTNTVNSTGLYQYTSMKREAPVVMLTFSYKINNFKQQPQKRNTDDSSESDFGGGSGGGME